MTSYAQTINGNVTVKRCKKESSIIFSSVSAICLTDECKSVAKMTKQQLVQYVNLEECHPKAVVTLNNKKYNISLSDVKLSNGKLVLCINGCKLPAGCFKNAVVKICACKYPNNVYGTLRLGGYNKKSFCCKQKESFKKGLATSAGVSASNVLVTIVDQVSSVDVTFIIITSSKADAQAASDKISEDKINGNLQTNLKNNGLSSLTSVVIERISPIPAYLSGTFIFSLPTSLWNNELPLTNDNNSFKKLNVSTKAIGTKTIVTVDFEYDTTVTTDPINSDGLWLPQQKYIENSEFVIEQYGFIPLSRGRYINGQLQGAQFSLTQSFGGRVEAEDIPSILKDTTLNSCFAGIKIKSSDYGNVSKWDVSNVTSMLNLFTYATLFNQPLNSWDVSNVTSMKGMFQVATSFNQPINSWNVSNVTTMYAMFFESSFNQPLDSWDVSKVTNMAFMFEKTPFNQPLNNWDVSNVTNMEAIFYLTNFNHQINNWNVSSVTNMNSMFEQSQFNQPLNNWDVSKVTNMMNMFNRTPFNQPLDKWNVSSVTNMNTMFAQSQFNQPLNNWNVSKVTTMYLLFLEATNFNQPLSCWDVSKVTNMSYMFSGAKLFNQPLNKWNVSNVTNMKFMFQGTPFNKSLNTWNVSKVTNMEGLFLNAPAFNQSLDKWNVFNVTSMQSMFQGAKSFNQPLNNWNVSKVKNMVGMFQGAKDFNQPLNKWNISNVQSIISMFNNATSFNQDLSSWNTKNVKSMTLMFYNSSQTKESKVNIIIGEWNISKVTDMQDMLYNIGMSVEKYSNILIGWAKQAPNIQSNVVFGGGTSYYNAEGAVARKILTDTYNWTITDSGLY
jgi:surface protein